MQSIRFCLFWLCLLCPIAASAAEADASDTTTPTVYINDRYDFSLSWPAGQYTQKEADNGDLTVQDKHGMVMNIYGTFSYHMLDKTFDDTLMELCCQFDNPTYKANKKAGWFVISGSRGDAIGYLKCLFTADHACIVDIAYPKGHKAEYDALIQAVSQSFKTGLPADTRQKP